MNYLGIDVAKKKLDCYLLLEGNRQKSKVAPNSEDGFQNLIAWCGKQGFSLESLHAVMESTGSYHEPAACALVHAGMLVSVVNPARVREFAKSQGILSKNDGLDALARFGAVSEPVLWHPPAAEARHLQTLLLRREVIEQDLRRETNRREKMAFTHAPDAVSASLMEHIAYLEQARDKLSHEIDRHIDQHPDLKKDRSLLQSIPGVGPKVSATLLVSLKQGQFVSAEHRLSGIGTGRATIQLFGQGTLSSVQKQPRQSSRNALHGSNHRQNA